VITTKMAAARSNVLNTMIGYNNAVMQ